MLNAIEVREYADFLALLYPTTVRIATRLYREADIKQLRHDFSCFQKNKGTVKFMDSEIAHMKSLKDYEIVFCQQYDATIVGLVQSRFPSLLSRLDDVIQDCRLVVVEMLWTYNGSVQIHTYAHTCIYNELQTLMGKYNHLVAGPSKKIAAQINELVQLMSDNKVSFEDAVSLLGNVHLSKYKDRALGGKSISISCLTNDKEDREYYNWEDKIAVCEDDNDIFNENMESMRQALEEVELTKLQRMALEWFLEGKPLCDLATRLNYTRQHISAQYVKALDIIREHMGVSVAV